MKDRIYCKYCKGLKYEEWCGNTCKYNYKLYDTPMSEEIEYSEVDVKNKHNDCKDFKPLGPIRMWRAKSNW